MRSSQRRCAIRVGFASAIVTVFGLLFGAGLGLASEAGSNLQLDVIINGMSIQMIGSFVRSADQKMAATVEELESLGLRPGRERSAQELVFLDEIPTLKYSYEETTQRILISVGDVGLKPRTFDLGRGGRMAKAEAGWGTVLNYDLLSSAGGWNRLGSVYLSGTSLLLDGRVFSPLGTLEQSAIARAGPQQQAGLLRLDTSFRYSDQDRMIAYGAGDLINGGLAWSRPIRLGGVQAQSNFALRPDLITMPLPTLGGSAVVPSSVDVYVNQIKTFSQEVGAGPFSISNVPLISGAGNAELVIRDSAGHETKSTVPFYAAVSLLAPGLTSWSVEAGLPRLSYGSTSDVYVDRPLFSATLRRGIYDGLTLEAHAEGGAGLANGGIGGVIRTGTFGVAGAAVSASRGDGGAGLQTYLSYETSLLGIAISANSQRSFAAYDDLASASARLQAWTAGAPLLTSLTADGPLGALPASNGVAYATGLYASARAPLALDRMTFSRQMPFDPKASLSTSLLHLRDAAGNLSNIMTASYSRALPANASMFLTVFRDFGSSKNTGVFAGLSMPLGEAISASTGFSRGQGGTSATLDVVKSMAVEPGSYGWRVRDAEGPSPYREASASYRSSYGVVQAEASQLGSSAAGSLGLRGSIVSMDGAVFLSNWVDDGFAVIDTGAPGIQVLHENRPAGISDAQGRLLIPSLRAYQNNRIAIDPVNLPIDAEIATTQEIVTPADRAGVLVQFKVRREVDSALVTFVSSDGGVIPAGSAGRLADGGDFVVGYDGQAFIKHLAAVNHAEIELANGPCHAVFPFAPRSGEQVQIAAVACR